VALNTMNQLEGQWAEPVSFTFPSVLRKLYSDLSTGAKTKSCGGGHLGFLIYIKIGVRENRRIKCFWRQYAMAIHAQFEFNHVFFLLLEKSFYSFFNKVLW